MRDRLNSTFVFMEYLAMRTSARTTSIWRISQKKGESEDAVILIFLRLFIRIRVEFGMNDLC